MPNLFEEQRSQEEAETDESLMRRFQSGEEEVFQTLFNRHASHLINFAYRFLRSQSESEDIAQEVLLRIYRGKDRYNPKRPFRPWFFSIAARLISNRLRDRKRHPQTPLDPIASEETQPPPIQALPDRSVSSPEEALDQQEKVQAVQKALDALPEDQCKAVLLARFEDMSYEEIAQTMEISVSAVKSLLFRAKQSLKRSLAAYARPQSDARLA